MTALARQDRLRSIGEVISALKGEFPDISPSKIRFLETEGLIKPVRTSSGYRKFGDDHIERLRCVLTMQRDQYLPLKVIRDRVADLDAGRVTEAELMAGPAAQVVSEGPGADADVVELRPGHKAHATVEEADEAEIVLPCDREELLQITGMSRSALATLEEYGMVTPMPSGRFGRDAIAVARAAATLAGYGLEPRHLRGFKYSADREVGTLRSALATVRPSKTPEAQSEVRRATQEVLLSFTQLHDALLREALRSG